MLHIVIRPMTTSRHAQLKALANTAVKRSYTTICGLCTGGPICIPCLSFISFFFLANAGAHIFFTRHRRLAIEVDAVPDLKTEYEKPVVSIFRLLVH